MVRISVAALLCTNCCYEEDAATGQSGPVVVDGIRRFESRQEAVDYILSAMRSSRAGIYSGSYTVTEKWAGRRGTWQNVQKVEFASNPARTRFHCTSSKSERSDFETTYINSPEESLSYRPTSRCLNVFAAPDDVSYAPHKRRHHDTFGLGVISEYRADVLFEDYLGFYAGYDLVDVAYDDGIFKMEFIVAGNAGWRRSLWVNETQGYTPTRVAYSAGAASYVTESQWKQIDEVWVPVSSAANSDSGNGKNSLEFDIEWHSVNQEMDGKLFERDSIGLPDGTAIVDHRIAPSSPVVTSIVGREDGDFPRKLVPKTRASRRGTPTIPPPRRNQLWWLFIINGALLLLYVGFRVFRARQAG